MRCSKRARPRAVLYNTLDAGGEEVHSCIIQAKRRGMLHKTVQDVQRQCGNVPLFPPEITMRSPQTQNPQNVSTECKNVLQKCTSLSSHLQNTPVF